MIEKPDSHSASDGLEFSGSEGACNTTSEPNHADLRRINAMADQALTPHAGDRQHVPTDQAAPAIGITIYQPEFVQVKYLQVRASVRYWEDATVNGQNEDEDSPAIPCRDADNYWSPLIDIHAGKITNWKEGTTASVHYKVCDEGRYALLREDKTEVCAIDGYVPPIMYPGGNGYGDYIIMDIGPDGVIADWVIDLRRFEEIAARARHGAA